MMGYHPGSTLHYRTAFDLFAEDDEHWRLMIKKIQSWVSERVQPCKGLGGNWFFRGGQLIAPHDSRTIVIVRSLRGHGNERSPQYWAMRFEHPCSQLSQRQWRIDIGLTRVENGRFRFVLTITHWIHTMHYIGEEPVPMPSSPRIVRILLNARNWRVVSGSALLKAGPQKLKLGEGKDFVEELGSPDRYCPYVLISLDYDSNKPLIDVERLALLLAGTANVYVLEGKDAEDELDYFFGNPKFACRGGMIRVYQRNVNITRESDSIRHRFINLSDIKQNGPAKIIELIVRGLARRGPTWFGHGIVVNIDDVEQRYRREKFLDLKQSISQEDSEKLSEVWAFADEIDKQNIKQQEQIVDLEQQVAAQQDEIETLRSVNENVNKNFKDIQTRYEIQKKQKSFGWDLNELPTQVYQVVEKLKLRFEGRLIFTTGAEDSAQQASLSDCNIAWRVLWSIGDELWRMYFEKGYEVKNIEREFKNKTGFELALSESKHTKGNKKLMRARRQIVDGEEIEFLSHVKYGNKEPKLLRVYYYPDKNRNLLFIGHCGDHLDNYSSRKQS